MNETALRMNQGMEFNNPFQNNDKLDKLVNKMNEMRTRANEVGVSVTERLANVRERLQIYAQIAEQKTIQIDHNLTLLAHHTGERIDHAVDYAIENPVDAAKYVAQKGWIYAAGAGARYAIMASGTALGYMIYPVTAIGSAVSSMVVGGYRDWTRMHEKNGALNLYRHYVGKDSLRADTYDDEEKTGWWNATKKFIGRHSMSVKEGYRRAYGAYTYREKLQKMLEDTGDENFVTYTERIANATANAQDINYRELHSLQAELRDKLVDATYAISVAMNNRDRKNGQQVVQKYFSVLQQTAKYTKADTAEFMRQIADTKNTRLESSARKGFGVTLMSRGTWSMVRFASGGAILGKFGKPIEVQAALTQQNEAHAPSTLLTHITKDDMYTSPAIAKQPVVAAKQVVTEKLSSPKIPAIKDNVLEEQRIHVQTNFAPKPTVELKPMEVTVLKNDGVFASLEKSGWGDTSEKGSAIRFMAEVAPKFRGSGLTEEQYQQLMKAVYEDKNMSAEDLWKKFKWFDKSFMVHVGKFDISVPQAANASQVIASNYDIKMQTIRKPGATKALFSLVRNDLNPPKPPTDSDTTGFVLPGGSSVQTNEVIPGGSSTITPVEANHPNPALAQFEANRDKRILQSSLRPQFYEDPAEPMQNTTIPQPPIPESTVAQPGEVLPGGPSLSSSQEVIPAGQLLQQSSPAPVSETPVPVVDQIVSTPTGGEVIPSGPELVTPVALMESKPEYKFNFFQKFFAQSNGKVIDISANNVKEWLHIPADQIPRDSEWYQLTVTEILGRKVILVHSARKDLMDLPGNIFREAIERGQAQVGFGIDQIKHNLAQAVSEGRTATFIGEDGDQAVYKLTNAQYMPYSEVVKNNIADLDKYIEKTNVDDVVVIFCGRSHSEAIRQGVQLMSSLRNSLSDEQAKALDVLIDGNSNGKTYDSAVKELFNFLVTYDKANKTNYYDQLILLYTGAPHQNSLEELRKANPYMFSGARYILALSPVESQ